MPSTIALDNSESHEVQNTQRLALVAQRKQIELAIEAAEQQIMKERIEKRRKITQIKSYLSSMKNTTKKPYHSGKSR